MTTRIGKKLAGNKIGKKTRRIAIISGRGGIVYGKSLQGAGAVATFSGAPEVGIPVVMAGKGIETMGRATKMAGQGKSISKIERRMTKDLTGGLV
tara:strand:- start:216 stop:500 length:285 start_codon:yes stop_codon:yes gene_type:complete